MPGAAPDRAGRPIGTTIEFQLLWHRVRVTTPDEDTAASIEAIAPTAGQPMKPLRTMTYDIETDGRGLILLEEGDLVGRPDGPEAARDLLYIRSHRRAFELASLMGWLRLHSALVDVTSRRVLLTGPSGIGKTTLAVRMLVDGHAVQGDESVLVRGGRAIAVPRPLHVEPDGAALVPELAPLLPRLPRVEGTAVLDPGRCGFGWQLREAPLDHVVLLGLGADTSTCRRVPQTEAMTALVPEAFPVTETKQVLLAELTAALAGVAVWRLSVGDPGAMRDALIDVIER
jgi:hypothetical protein